MCIDNGRKILNNIIILEPIRVDKLTGIVSCDLKLRIMHGMVNKKLYEIYYSKFYTFLNLNILYCLNNVQSKI